MSALDVDTQGESLPGCGSRAGIETRDERPAQLNLNLALALLLGFDAVGTEVEERFGAELLYQLHGHGEEVLAGLRHGEAGIEEMLGPETEQNLAVGRAEALAASAGSSNR